MASITNVINVALLPEGQAAARDNMNVVAIFTSEQGVLTSADRYRSYRDASAVEADWGTSSAVTSYANIFFGTQPNPVNFGGALIIGYHRGATETTAATAGVLKGSQIQEAAALSALQLGADWSFSITVDGLLENVVGLDLRVATSLQDVVALIGQQLKTSKIKLENSRIIITSEITGATSSVSLASPAESGTFIGNILGISAGSGALSTNGVESATLPPETKLEALSVVKSKVNFKGFCFIDQIIDSEVDGIAAWCKAVQTIGYAVFSGAEYLEIAVDNPVWKVRLAGQTSFRCLYSGLGNRQFAASYMSRTHTVNFSAENSAMTMHLKTLSIPAETYSQTEIDKAKRVGLDIYTSIKDVPVVLTSHVNDFVDNVYNLAAYVDAVQTDMFNLLKGTATKIPQTVSGVKRLIDQGEKTSRGFARAGVIGAGTWSSPDSFGDLDTFNRNIEASGFYWLAGSLSDQPQSERQERKSPVLQNAIKNAGAIHSVDVIINFNY
jgi:hypothetical protein